MPSSMEGSVEAFARYEEEFLCTEQCRRHRWYSYTREEFKSNPPQIVAVCIKCEKRMSIYVVDHWSKLDALIREERYAARTN